MAIAGTAGVGKTALAVYWAHRVGGQFPDGQLYADLRGYDPGQPADPADVLAAFLRALGVPGQDIPPEAQERAALYRSLLAGRRMLVLLDNASAEEQVRPLLPGSPSCMTVVTSRAALVGLIARDGAARLDLDLLPLADAVDLLRALIGGRAETDLGALQALAEHCCRLPLALRVAAELAASRPAVPLASLATELAGQRLDLLDAGGDPRSAVRVVFSWSCRHLDPAAARAFRLAGLHPGPDLDAYAVAALTSTTAAQAGQALGRLARAHLIHPTQPGRYGMHDLLRSYAKELAESLEGEQESRTALTRLFDYYLYAAAAAMDAHYPADYIAPRLRPCEASAPGIAAPPLADPAAALAWLDGHRATFVSVADCAADRGWPGHAARLAATVFRYLDSTGYFAEAVAIHACAYRAACQAADRVAQAEALTSLAVTDWRLGSYRQATSRLRRSLTVFRELGDLTGQIRALGNLSEVSVRQGRPEQAIRCMLEVLALSRELGDQPSETRALSSLAEIYLQLGRYERAADLFGQVQVRYRDLGHRTGEAGTLANLGELDLLKGHHERAARRFHQALATFRATGDRANEATTLVRLGHARLLQRRYEPAARYLRQALALFSRTVDRSAEAQALDLLGEVLLATDERDTR